jgi:hypothetical protein
LKYLFWNTCKKVNRFLVAELLSSYDIDILSLAEFNDDPKETLEVLTSQNLKYYHVPQINCNRIHLFSKLPSSCFGHRTETSYYTIKEIEEPSIGPTLLCFVHLPSKLFMSEDDQMDESRLFKMEVEATKKECNVSDTIIMGDFNMNPFERGMAAASGIHSIPCRLTAQRGSREVKGRSFSMFYNPMWNLLGDSDDKPGSYYFAGAIHLNYFWHLLDQVIIRPSLIPHFRTDSLTIIDVIGTNKLVDDHHRPKISDHLPIYFVIGGK